MRIIKKDIRGYWGMNHEAGKELHIKNNPPEGTIYINKSLHGIKEKKVIVHEEVESYMMKHNHLKYKDAHRIANKFEKNIR